MNYPMTLRDFYQNTNKPAISFELFPPKSDAAMDNLREILPGLIGLTPDFMTVTYGALGSTQERTLEIATLMAGAVPRSAI